MSKLKILVVIFLILYQFIIGFSISLHSQTDELILESDPSNIIQHTITADELLNKVKSGIYTYIRTKIEGDVDFTELHNIPESFKLSFKYCEFDGDFKINEITSLYRNVIFAECVFKTSSVILLVPIEISLYDLMTLSHKLGWEYIQIFINNYGYKAQDIKLLSDLVSNIDRDILQQLSVAEYALLIKKFKEQNISLIHNYDANKLAHIMKILYYLKDNAKKVLDLEELSIIADRLDIKVLPKLHNYTADEIRRLIEMIKYMDINLDKFYVDDLYELSHKVSKSDFDKLKRYYKHSDIKKIMIVLDSLDNEAENIGLDDLDIISKRVKQKDFSKLYDYKEDDVMMLSEILLKHYSVYHNIGSYMFEVDKLHIIHDNILFISSLPLDKQASYVEFLSMSDFEQIIHINSTLLADSTLNKIILMFRNFNTIFYMLIFFILSSLIMLFFIIRYLIRKKHHNPHH